MPTLSVDLDNQNDDLKHAVINFSGSGANTIIAAGTSLLKIFKLFLCAGGTTNLTFQADGSTALSGAVPMIAGSALILPFSTKSWFVIPAGAAFVINSSQAVAIGGVAYYS